MYKVLRLNKKVAAFLLPMVLLIAAPASAESLEEIKEKMAETVSFFMTVEPGEKSLTSSNPVHIGDKEIPYKELMTYLHKGRTLVVKTVIVENVSLPFPATDAYSVVSLARCDVNTLATGGFGNSAIATYGLQSNPVHYNPGLLVTLLDQSDSLCVSSYIQSNETARVFIHGVLI